MMFSFSLAFFKLNLILVQIKPIDVYLQLIIGACNSKSKLSCLKKQLKKQVCNKVSVSKFKSNSKESFMGFPVVVTCTKWFLLVCSVQPTAFLLNRVFYFFFKFNRSLLTKGTSRQQRRINKSWKTLLVINLYSVKNQCDGLRLPLS